MMIRLCGIALFAAVVYAVQKVLNPSGTAVLGASVTVIFSLLAIVSLTPLYETFEEFFKETELEPYAATVLKALGIAYSVEITGDICRAGGAESVASSIELVGRAELAILAFPLITELFGIASSFFTV